MIRNNIVRRITDMDTKADLCSRAVDIGDLIRQRRRTLGLSQSDLADAAGVKVRQIARYEGGEQEPSFSVAVALADALNISLSQLAGRTPHGLDLTGEWWASWQTYKDGEEYVSLQEVRIIQQDDALFRVEATTRGLSVEDGGYLWHGELRLWDGEILMGWYAANDGAVRSKGTLYFVLHPHGLRMVGRWVGLSYDGKIVTGFAAISKTEADPPKQIELLKTGKALP